VWKTRAARLAKPARMPITNLMSPAPYVPLRIFSSYTMLEGAIEPKGIAKQAKKLDFPAAALADRNGLYAAIADS
jgi:DNA polymerase-3 subunit alpha